MNRLVADQGELESKVVALKNERIKGYISTIGNQQRVDGPQAKADAIYRTRREGRLVNLTLPSAIFSRKRQTQ